MDYSKLGNKKLRRIQNPHTTRVRNKVSLLVLRVVLSLVLIVGVGAVGVILGAYEQILEGSPELHIGGLGFDVSPQNLTSFIRCAQTGEELERLHDAHNFEFADFDQFPQHLIDAFIAIEDERFFEHNGIDPHGIARALYNAAFTDLPPQGGSTITQQLIKNHLRIFSNDFITKLQEQYLAINLERHLTEQFALAGYYDPRGAAKDFILQSYLNIISLGRQNYGVQAAAWFYYGICVSELSIVQSATIAAITQNPSRFPPDIHPLSNWGRTRLVLRNMHRLGFITDEEFEEAMQERQHIDPRTGLPVYDEDGEPVMIGIVYDTIYRTADGGTRPVTSEFDCFTDALLVQVRDDLVRVHNMPIDHANRLIFTGGLQIFSTQDRRIQQIVCNAFLDDSLWPSVGLGFSIEVTHHMTVRNTITQEPRRYRHVRVVDSLEEAEAFIQEMIDTHVSPTCEVTEYRTFKVSQPQGAFVIMDHHTGHVVAMRGIRGEKQGNRMFNRATEATRSPGSQLKPLIPFGPLFEVGLMQPSTVIDDIPFTLVNPHGPDWTPGNWWGSTYEGLSTARRAIYRSQNVVSARAGADTTIIHAGVPAMHMFLEQLGITTLHPNDGAAIVMGGMTHGTSLIELTGAFAAVANLGEFHRPVLYTVVLDHEGRILLENPYDPQRVMRATTAYLLTHSMQDTITRGTGGAINWEDRSMRGTGGMGIAGKTGTSQRNRDLGFVGYTPYFTAALWMGNDNELPMHRRSADFHRPLWRIIMEEIHRDMPNRGFDRPPGIVTAQVCLDSGHLPGPYCRQDPRGNRVRNEVFAQGHVPTHVCAVHQQFTYCHYSGELASPNCPYWHVHTRVGIVRPVPIDHIEANVADRVHEFPIGVRQGTVCHIHNHQFLFDTFTDNWANWGIPQWGNETPHTHHPPLPWETDPQPTPTPPITHHPGIFHQQPRDDDDPESTPSPFTHTVPVPGLDLDND